MESSLLNTASQHMHMHMPQFYLVGGAVRDLCMGITPYDLDYVVVGATPEWMLAQGYLQVGQDFPVFLHPQSKAEYALARTERKSAKGYKGFICAFSPYVTLEDDLLRRDFCMNAMALPVDEQHQARDITHIIDPWGGRDDIQQCQIRHVSPAFAEDPLRILRLGRFIAQLGFNLAEQTQAFIIESRMCQELVHIAKERIWLECVRGLNTARPWLFWQILHRLGAWHALYPRVFTISFDMDHTSPLSDCHQAVWAEVMALQPSCITQQPLPADKQAAWHLLVCWYIQNLDIAICWQDFLKHHHAPKSVQHFLQAQTRACTLIKQTYTQGHPLTASDYLECLYALDAWRHPDDVAYAATLLAHMQKKPPIWVERMLDAFHTAQKTPLNMVDIAPNGIRQYVKSQRLVALQQEIDRFVN